jgi:hypothetical protein
VAVAGPLIASADALANAITRLVVQHGVVDAPWLASKTNRVLSWYWSIFPRPFVKGWLPTLK